MKKNILFILLYSMYFYNAFGGFINGTLQYKGDTRRYKIYIPDVYLSQNIKVPLVLGLHGYGDNIDNFGNICMNNIADTANYICVYAEALPWMGANAWNSGAGVGAIKVNKDEDDVGFLNGILDTIIANYKIDTTRIYVFGFSFGGFMTDRLATECTNRFAAACNVSGLHGNFLAGITPSTSMPYLKFHGTNDATISYDGTKTVNIFPGFGLSAENTVNFWVTKNNCNTTPIIDSMPNIANDGLRFVRYSYNNGTNNSKVVFYKVINGEHSWYGLPTNDISYCQTIWSFFRQNSRQSTITSVRNNFTNESFRVYPNPSSDRVTIDISTISNHEISSLNIYNMVGSIVLTVPIKNQKIITIDTPLDKGIYLLQLSTATEIIATEKLSIQ